jgi:sugar fermentation stimulation protein A
MQFPEPLIEGILLRRYKRFLADIRLPDGTVVTAHAPNTGSMLGCDEPGSRVWLRDTGNPRRKYPLSWELVEADGGVLVGTNTSLANRLVAEGIDKGAISELQGYEQVRSEVPYGDNSRIDLLLERARESRAAGFPGPVGGRPAAGKGGRGEGRESCYVEVKNVTMVRDGSALFPDSVSLRATRHLAELERVAADGHRAVVFFCLQRDDADRFHPADEIDPDFGMMLRRVAGTGVELLAYSADVSTAGISIGRPLSVDLS